MIKKWIKNLYDKLYKVNIQKEKNIENLYVGGLSFKLTKKSDVDLEYVFPTIEDKNLEEMTILAEKYAKFLVCINQGYFTEDLLDIIEKNANKTRDPKQKLFWDNIISFWSIYEQEIYQKNQSKTDDPLIRPMSVFTKIEGH